ncbi:MAG: hypothetical protein L3J21_04950 [Devosiaceae bacterium]|nr:hypothetical protein [Devosiaceae bacterium]
MKIVIRLLLMTLPFVALGVGFVAYTISNKPAPVQNEVAERAIAVRVIEARSTLISPQASGFGLIAPERTYEAISQVTGTAIYINPLLRKGDILPAGAVLVRLSDRDYKLAAAQARANIRSAEAKLAEIEVSMSNLQAGLAIEEESLELKELELERLLKLYEAGTASQAAREGGRSAYLTQSQKVQNLRGSLALLPTQRQVQTEQIAVYQTTLETAELNLARTEMRLPFAARVDTVSVEIGQLVSNGQTVAKLDGINAAEVEAQIPASDMQILFTQYGNVTPGIALAPSELNKLLVELPITAQIELKLGLQSIVWPATLDRISNSIDQKTGAMGVILRVDNAYTSAQLGTRPPLTKGMFVEAVLTADPVEGIAIPRNALRGNKVMLVDAQNRLRLVPVTVSFYRDRMAVITGGVDEGAKIVVSIPVPMIEGILLELHMDNDLMQEISALGPEGLGALK